MKKIFGVVAMAVVLVSFMACGNSKATNTEEAEIEVPTMENVVETEEIDTVAVSARGESESGGFGRCFESGCYCKEFKGRGQTCQNCGHAYRRHY